MPAQTDRLLEKLRQFDTPTICNVIELFEVRPRNTGYMDDRIRCGFPEMPPMVGYAATATFRASGPPRAGDVYANMEQQIERFTELSGPAVVVFQDLDVPPAAATFGEIMCTTYKTFGAVGLITSGAGRDLDQVRAIDFPVFTNGTICAHGYCHTVQVHVPVYVGGLVVYPDDLLHGDLNGVTSIPADIAGEVADAAGEFMAAEAIILEALRRESPSPEQFHQARLEANAQMAKLRKRLSRAAG